MKWLCKLFKRDKIDPEKVKQILQAGVDNKDFKGHGKRNRIQT